MTAYVLSTVHRVRCLTQVCRRLAAYEIVLHDESTYGPFCKPHAEAARKSLIAHERLEIEARERAERYPSFPLPSHTPDAPITFYDEVMRETNP